MYVTQYILGTNGINQFKTFITVVKLFKYKIIQKEGHIKRFN